MSASTRHPQQIVALGLAVAMVTSSCRNAPGVGQGGVTPAVAPAARSSVATNPADAGAKPSPPGQLRNELEQAFRAVEAFAAAVPADTFDPAAVLAKTGRDPAAIFHWVRDRTVWVPYRGVLRGPVGVLMDRTGNDLDRALLLAQLLKLAGKQVRLARGTLSDVQTGDVLRAARLRPMGNSLSAPELSAEVKALLDQYAKDNPTDAVNVRRFADELLQRAARMEREAGERSASQARAVAEAVFPASRGPAAPGPADLEPLREHWWVQSLEGPDWTDFDPTMPQSEPGRPLTNAQSTAAPEALDSALYHEVEIRVITERWERGRLEQAPILTHVLRPSELYGLDVSLSHVPIAWPKDFNTVHMTDLPKRLKAIGLSQHEWLPVLQVGSKLIFQFSFTDAGIKRSARPGPLGGTGTGIERGIEGVSGLFGSSESQTKDSILTGEWIEYEIRSPGQPTRRIRRQLFDSIGPAQRTAAAATEPTMTDGLHRNLALALLGRTDILILGCQPSREFVGHLFAQRLLDDRQPLLNLVSTAPQEEETLQGMLADVTPVPGPLYGLAMARSRWSRYHNDVYSDRPIILSAHQQVREGPDGDLAGAYSFDIVANDVAVRTDSKIDAPLVRLEQGVEDTAAEWLLASAFLETGGDGQTTSSVSEIFRLARAQGVDWSAIRSVDDPAWQRIQLGADARARINQDLAAGYIVVAPNRPVMLNGHTRVGWWRVDPKSGQSLGVDDMGWGATIVEYMHIVANVSSIGLCLHKAKKMADKNTGYWVGTACAIGGSFALLGPASSSVIALCAKVCFLLAGGGALLAS